MIFADYSQMCYKDGYKYQLTEPLRLQIPIYPTRSFSTSFVSLSKTGELVLFRGYACDGGSGPAIDNKSAMRAFFVHDALYQLIRLYPLELAWLREPADKLLKVMYLFDACSKIPPDNWKNKIPNTIRRTAIKTRANYIYWAVRKFGKSAAFKPKKIHKAP